MESGSKFKVRDGFLCLKVTEETIEEEINDGPFQHASSFFDFPDELESFLRGLNGKKTF